MIGLDTNALVRLFAQDDPQQSKRVEQLIGCLSPESPGWISTAVLMELAWVMTKIYHVSRSQLVNILTHLIAQDGLLVEQAETVRKAIHLFARSRAGFADCLIAASARAAGCARTVTFDRVAARDADMELLA